MAIPNAERCDLLANNATAHELRLDATESGYVSDDPLLGEERPHRSWRERLTAHVAHPAIRRELERLQAEDENGQPDERLGDAIGEAVFDIIDFQLALYGVQTKKNIEICFGRREVDSHLVIPGQKSRPDRQEPTSTASESLLDILKVIIPLFLGKGREADIASLEIIKGHPAFKQVVYRSGRVPFSALLNVTPQSEGIDTESGGERLLMGSNDVELDHLIMLNERFMRARVSLDELNAGRHEYLTQKLNPNKAELEILKGGSQWQDWMIGLGRDGDVVFGDTRTTILGSEPYILPRPEVKALPGLKALHPKRKENVEVRTLASFKKKFAEMTANMFEGFDWSNVVVVGGLVLAALTATTEDEINAAKGDAIELYVYALSAADATAKLYEIEEAYKKGLPEVDGAKMEYAVSRTSKMVTFLPAKYPHRRVQVVLKLFSSPMSVLTNCDLDPLGVGFDGEEVWMLPRTVRALFTGFTTFTMDLVHGHYLDQRCATQDVRIWEFGRRGYGLRFLPSYLEAVKMKMKDVDNLYRVVYKGGDPPENAATQRQRSAIELILARERLAVDWFLACKTFVNPDDPTSPTLPSVLTCKEFDVPEVAGRNPMGSFALFARHIALNEHHQLGQVILEQHQAYGAFDTGNDYDPLEDIVLSRLAFDDSFTLDAFRKNVEKINAYQYDKLRNIFRTILSENHHRELYASSEDWDSDSRVAPILPLDRVILRPTLSEAWVHQMNQVVFMPKRFSYWLTPSDGPLSPVFNFDKLDTVAAETLQNKIDNRLTSGVYFYWGHYEGVWQYEDRFRDGNAEVLSVMARMADKPSLSSRELLAHFQRVTSVRMVRPSTREESSALSRWLKEPLGKYEYDTPSLNAAFELLMRRMKLRARDVRGWGGSGEAKFFQGPHSRTQDNVLHLTLRRGQKRKAETESGAQG